MILKGSSVHTYLMLLEIFAKVNKKKTYYLFRRGTALTFGGIRHLSEQRSGLCFSSPRCWLPCEDGFSTSGLCKGVL